MSNIMDDKQVTTKGLWDRRYEEEGHIWGDEPSQTARIVTDLLDFPNNNIIEVGYGYGRDLVEMVRNGHRVYGIETSTVGQNEAIRSLREIGRENQAGLLKDEFTNAAIPTNFFDALYSHRMLHLLGSNGLVRAFANKASKVLKPGGLICISARDKRDFDPEQMKDLGNGQAEYIIEGREGHVITFWDEERFKDVFSEHFDISDNFIKGEEIESLKNPDKVSNFTIMTGHKKKPSSQKVFVAPSTPSPSH